MPGMHYFRFRASIKIELTLFQFLFRQVTNDFAGITAAMTLFYLLHLIGTARLTIQHSV